MHQRLTHTGTHHSCPSPDHKQALRRTDERQRDLSGSSLQLGLSPPPHRPRAAARLCDAAGVPCGAAAPLAPCSPRRSRRPLGSRSLGPLQC